MCKGKIKVTAEVTVDWEDEDATSKEELLEAFKVNADYTTDVVESNNFTFEVVEFVESEDDEDEEVEAE